MKSASLAVPVRTAHQREERRIRIMGMVRAGFSYEAIAREENVSRERIRQIVTRSLNDENRLERIDQNRVQMARLEPALRLAARGIENGKLQAIGPLLKVLERLDKYGAVVESVQTDWAVTHERLMKKINKNVEKLGIEFPPEPGGAAEGGRGRDEAFAGAADGAGPLAEKTGWTDL